MSTPLVSVIIPLYNCEQYIEDSLESILAQTYQNLEVIVVNDGSTDGGPAIVESIMGNDERVKLYHQENKGQCAASNAGFAKSKGAYIKFFDADDLLTKDTIAIQLATLAGQDEFVASYIDYVRFYDDDLSTINRYVLPSLINYDCSPLEYIKFHGSPQMYQCGLWLFKRSIFAHTGLWDERLSLINDTEFFPRIFKKLNKLCYAPGNKLYYRTNFNSGSLSQQTSLKAIQSAVLAVDLMADYIRTMERSAIIDKIIALSYADVLWMSYPSQPAMTKLIEERLLKFPIEYYDDYNSGGYFGKVKKVVGWKLAKRLQLLFHNAKYANK